MKGYKVFNSDWKCNGFQYEVGKTFKYKNEIQLCEEGFHFCEKLQDCFSYYSFNHQNKVAIVEAIGKIIIGGDKHVTNEIKIIKELSWEEVLKLVNSGYRNSGYRNSGDLNSGNGNSRDQNSGNGNSGYRNSGYRNSGDLNSGDRNSGNLNSGNLNSGNLNSGNRNSGDRNSGNENSGSWNIINDESGCFNSENSKYIRVFNKKCLLSTWVRAEKPDFIYFYLIIWVDFNKMSTQEKDNNPNAEICGGYLKTLNYKEAWRLSYEKASTEDIKLLKKLPNFDRDVFHKISGIKID